MSSDKKRKIGNFTESTMREAVELVLKGDSLRKVAELKKISFQTLARYVKKARETENIEEMHMCPNYSVNKIFTEAEEKSLEEYIINCSQMFYGLPVNDCRKLAYEMAVRNNKKIPDKWHEGKMAGLKWMRGFRERHPRLSLRTPEGCSLSRATSFNRHNVTMFFENLKNIYARTDHFADGSRIYNLDETSTMTVQKPQKVLAVKGIKQVNKVTSGERGVLVTTCCIINATGQYLPPAMVFPRTHFKEHMLRGAPAGALGLAAPSGWMNAELFVEVMKHFIKFSHSSKDNPALLIYDNHESHLSITVLNLAKENGVTVLTVPPHSTNKLQPLDVGVYKPFSTAYSAAIDTWMMQHPGKPLTIYDVAACVGFAHEKAITPSNVISAFKKCGIYPYDANIFTDVDYLASSVTDRALETYTSDMTETTLLDSTVSPKPSTNITAVKNDHLDDTNQDTNTNNTGSSNTLFANKVFQSPEMFKGYPRAEARKSNNKRRKGKSIIATDTPEKNAIEERSKAKKTTANKIQEQKIQKIKKSKLFEDTDSSSEEELHLSSLSGDECFVQIDPDGFEDLHKMPIAEDFVLVEFKAKKSIVYFVGKVLKRHNNNDDYEITFLRNQRRGANKFVYPDVADVHVVLANDIKFVLPPPILCGHTSRQKATFTFEIDFSLINIR